MSRRSCEPKLREGKTGKGEDASEKVRWRRAREVEA